MNEWTGGWAGWLAGGLFLSEEIETKEKIEISDRDHHEVSRFGAFRSFMSNVFPTLHRIGPRGVGVGV